MFILHSISNEGERIWKGSRGHYRENSSCLFENTNPATMSFDELEASGFPRKTCEFLGEPREMAGSGFLSTPHNPDLKWV